jgi:transposase
VHSRYIRGAADLPWQGLAVRLQLHARRFFCLTDGCPQQIFCERLPQVIAPYARRTLRLNDALRLIGFALGGNPGARLALSLGMSVSHDTLLRRIRQAALPAHPPLRVIGVDDWANRKRHHYGTIIVDLERRRPIDLLPDREAETLATWLRAHPGVEVICRDRAGAYAEGATAGAPQAVQVVDRFHLLQNVVAVLHRVLQKQSGKLRQAYQAVHAQPASVNGVAAPAKNKRVQARAETRARRLALYQKVRRLHQQGVSQREIAKRLGICVLQVRRLIKAESFPERAPFPPRPTSVDAHAEYLKQRWAEGCQIASQLWREIQARGFTGPVGAVIRYVRERLRDPRQVGVQYKRRTLTPAPSFAQPSARQTAWLLLKEASELTRDEEAYLAQVRALCTEVNSAEQQTKDFREMVRGRKVEALEGWLQKAEESGGEWKNFVAGLRREEAAVKAALAYEWSQGPVEGHINRLKLVKRQMFGRAKFDLLRKRVLQAA